MEKGDNFHYEWVDIERLKIDNKNPNKMTPDQKAALWRSIQKYGWVYPIITNDDYMIADGEQRYAVSKDHNLKRVPVLRLGLKEVDRKIIRQVMNKLRGVHDPALDTAEFSSIVSMGGAKELQELLNMDDVAMKYIQSLPMEAYGDPTLVKHVSKSAPLNSFVISFGNFSSYCDRLISDFDKLRDITTKLNALSVEKKVTIASEYMKWIEGQSQKWLK
jgi:hypothetical protein